MNRFNMDNTNLSDHLFETDYDHLGKQNIDFDFLVGQFFDMFQLYLSNMPEDKRDCLINEVFSGFSNRFNCDFDEDIIMINLPYKPELRDFFIGKFVYINEYLSGFYHFDEESYIEKVFNRFPSSVHDLEVDTSVSRKLETFMPEYAKRYNINNIISQFAHDLINRKNVNLNDRYKYSKKLIICFIYFSILTQFNKKYEINVNGSTIDFKDKFQGYFPSIKKTSLRRGGYVTETSADRDIYKFMNDLTDSFAHVSGNFNYIYSEDKVEFKNRFDSTMDINVTEFLDGMESLFKNDLPSLLPSDFNGNLSDVFEYGSINVLLRLVDKIKVNDFDSIENDEIIFLMSYLQLCFNQEGLFDTEIMSQYSLIDCSDFELDYGFEIDDIEASNIEIFKSHHLVYTDSQTEEQMNNFWSNHISDFNDVSNKKAATLCDMNRMVYDTRNNIFIPSSEVIIHLRNSFRHGRYRIEGDRIHFYDQKNSNDRNRPNQQYFNLSIDMNNFLRFLSNNIINEVLYIEFNNLYNNDGRTDEFVSSREHNKIFLYETEMAYAKNSFKNYMDILKTRFFFFSFDDFIDVLVEHKLISRYLADNIDKYDEFLNYQIRDGVKLVDVLRDKYNFDINVADSEIDQNINLCNSLVDEMKSLIGFELKNTNSDESVFFKLFYEEYYKKANIFLNDFSLPKEFKDQIRSSKLDSNYILGGINYDKKSTQSCLLNLALFKHEEFSEVDRLNLLRASYVHLQSKYGSDMPINFSYENIIKCDNSSDMFMESTINVVKNTRRNSVLKKGLKVFKGLFSLGFVSSVFMLSSINSNNFLDPVNCTVMATVLGYMGLYKYVKGDSNIKDIYRVVDSRVSDKYIFDKMENDDFFQRHVRRNKR